MQVEGSYMEANKCVLHLTAEQNQFLICENKMSCTQAFYFQKPSAQFRRMFPVQIQFLKLLSSIFFHHFHYNEMTPYFD